MTAPYPRLACIESPFAGDVERNVMYADCALLHAINMGDVPFAGHLLYTRVLDDRDPKQRELGIACHVAMLRACHVVLVYADLGISRGMQAAIDRADGWHIPIEYRYLGSEWRELHGHCSRSPGI